MESPDYVRIIPDDYPEGRVIPRSLLQEYEQCIFTMWLEDDPTCTTIPTNLTLEQYDAMMAVLTGKRECILSDDTGKLLIQYGFTRDPREVMIQNYLIKVDQRMKMLAPLLNGEVSHLFCHNEREYKKFKPCLSHMPDIVPVQVITLDGVLVIASYDDGVPLYNVFGQPVQVPVTNGNCLRAPPDTSMCAELIKMGRWANLHRDQPLNMVAVETGEEALKRHPKIDAPVDEHVRPVYSDDETKYINGAYWACFHHFSIPPEFGTVCRIIPSTRTSNRDRILAAINQHIWSVKSVRGQIIPTSNGGRYLALYLGFVRLAPVS